MDGQGAPRGPFRESSREGTQGGRHAGRSREVIIGPNATELDYERLELMKRAMARPFIINAGMLKS
jgi:hypothetical protein